MEKVIPMKFILFFEKKHKKCFLNYVMVLLNIVKFERQKLTLITLTYLGVELPLQRVKIKTSFYQNKNL